MMKAGPGKSRNAEMLEADVVQGVGSAGAAATGRSCHTARQKSESGLSTSKS